MKKSVVLLLAICMLATIFVGCGSENNPPAQVDTTQAQQQVVIPNETQQTNQEVAVGTILDAPEVQFDNSIEEIYLYVTFPGDTAEETGSMELALNQITPDTYLIYVTDGLLKTHELVYEVTDSGVTKYWKDAFMDAFSPETEASQQQIEAEKNETLSLISYFTMGHEDYTGYKYRKSDDIVFALTGGDVYVYDVLENNECVGQMCIDKATGVMVKFEDAQGNTIYNVQKLQTSNVEIPEYK